MSWKPGTNLVYALCLIGTASGCAQSVSPAGVPIPDLPATVRSPCPDADIPQDAVAAVAAARLALATCRRKHDNVVRQYDEVRAAFGQKEGSAVVLGQR